MAIAVICSINTILGFLPFPVLLPLTFSPPSAFWNHLTTKLPALNLCLRLAPMAASQGIPAATRSWKRQGTDSPLEPNEADIEPLASRPVIKHISDV